MSEPESNGRQRIKFGGTVRSDVLPSIRECPFPDRLTIHWVPPDKAMTDGFSIVITSDVLLKISRHVAQTLNYEIGGFLLGNRCFCPNTGRNYITIDQYVGARFTKSSNVSLTFTHETFGDLDEALTGKYYGKKLLGWYHSHPRMSIFLSEDDLVIHRERFVEPWMVALVLEPEKQLGGFFSWTDGKIDPNRYVNFYELLNNGVRESVLVWKNYEGFDPLKGAPPLLSAITTQATPVSTKLLTETQSMLSTNRTLPFGLQGNVLWLKTAMLVLMVLVVSTVLGFFIKGIVTHPTKVVNENVNQQPTPSPTGDRTVSAPEPSPSSTTPGGNKSSDETASAVSEVAKAKETPKKKAKPTKVQPNPQTNDDYNSLSKKIDEKENARDRLDENSPKRRELQKQIDELKNQRNNLPNKPN